MSGFLFPKSLNIAGLQGDPVFFDEIDDTDPGNEQTLFTITVGAGSVMNLQQILGRCSMPGVLRVFHGTSLIGSGSSEAGNPNIFFSWFPPRSIPEGETVEVKFRALPNLPSVPVEAYLMTTEES